MKYGYFGKNWGAPVLKDLEQVDTPVGQPCLHCKEPILAGEQGEILGHVKLGEQGFEASAVAVHRECEFRAIVGGIAHVEKRCSCFRTPEARAHLAKILPALRARIAQDADEPKAECDPDDGLGWRESARRVMKRMGQ